MAPYWTRFVLAAAIVAAVPQAASAITLKEAVRRAAFDHPSVGAATANRDATGYELLQAQGRFLPTIDLNAEIGGQRVDKPRSPPPGNDRWLNNRQVGISIRQFVFDGFDRVNDVYRNAARVDAATFRILQRSELRALEAIEAYIDVRRHRVVLDLARHNEQRHRSILGTVREVVEGGKAPQSDIAQARERLAASQALTLQVEKLLADAEAKFLQVVGTRAHDIGKVGKAKNLPKGSEAALKVAARHNPLLLASKADIDAARFGVEQSRSALYPQIALQGDATYGEDIDGIYGRNADVTGKVVLSWNVFNGGIKQNRVRELEQRLGEAEADYATRVRLVREAVENAYSAYDIGARRVEVGNQQVAAARNVVASYTEEYKLSKRSLLDLLDAESASFNALFQLNNVYALHTFASYQVLASTGTLLSYFGLSQPATDKGGLRAQAREGVFNLTLDPLK